MMSAESLLSPGTLLHRLLPFSSVLSPLSTRLRVLLLTGDCPCPQTHQTLRPHPSAGGGRGGVGERIAGRQSKYFHFQHSSEARMHECRCLHDKQVFGSGVGGDLHLTARRSRCAAHFHFLASVCSLTAGSLECETPKGRAEAGRCAELRCVQGPAQAEGPNGNSKGSDVLRLLRVFQPVPQVAFLLST